MEVKTSIKPIKISKLKLKIKGITPFLSEPMDMAVPERYGNKKANKIFDKDTVSEQDKVKTKYYYTTDGKKGIPSRAFYKAMIRASSYLFDKKDGGMRNIREGIMIQDEVIPVKFSKEDVLTHVGRQSGMTRAPRIILRNAFYDWELNLEISFNSEQVSSEQIYNILNWAGFHIGVGAFRKENSGNFGAFEVAR